MASRYDELLHAYVLGCLDAEKYREVNEYLKSGKDFHYQELGEFQNLVALLPSILNIEEPDAEVKNNVARKLYKLQEEIKAKQNIERKEQLKEDRSKNSFPPVSKSEKEEINIKDEKELKKQDQLEDKKKKETGEEPIRFKRITSQPENREIINEFQNKKQKEKSEKKEEEFEVVTPKSKTDEFFRPDDKTQVRERFSKKGSSKVSEKKQTKEEKKQSKNIDKKPQTPSKDELINNYKKRREVRVRKSNRGIIIGFILFFILIIALIVGYLSINSEVKDYKTEIEQLKEQISSLNMQVESNRDIQSLLESDNVTILSLKGTGLNPSGNGKLIISFEMNKGYIQVSQLPILPEGKVYQLWIGLDGNYTSLGTFNVKESVEYMPFEMPEISEAFDIRFLVTEESIAGANEPGGRVYLRGNLK